MQPIMKVFLGDSLVTGVFSFFGTEDRDCENERLHEKQTLITDSRSHKLKAKAFF